MKSTFSQQHNRGFTLLETLIAILILTLSLSAAFGIAQKSLQSSAFSKNQTAAFFMATEGLELVRNVRDNVSLYNEQNSSATVNWLQPFKDSSVCNTALLDGACGFDIDPVGSLLIKAGGGLNSSASMKVCPATGCRMAITPSSGEIYYDSISGSTAGSIFYRKITIKEICYSTPTGLGTEACPGNDANRKEAIVTSTVYWLGESFSISETLTNWQ